VVVGQCYAVRYDEVTCRDFSFCLFLAVPLYH
jgi:hypothetical protein